MNKLILFAALCGYVCGQQAKQASAGPISDFLGSVGAPKIGYAPGVHQAVANTGAQPNPFNLLPGIGGQGTDGKGAPGQFLQAPLQAFGGLAQAGQQALQGFGQASGQLFQTALQPFQQLAQALANISKTSPNNGGLLGGIIARIGNRTATTPNLKIAENIIPVDTTKAPIK